MPAFRKKIEEALLLKTISTFSIFDVPCKEFHQFSENNTFLLSLNSYLELHLIVLIFELVDKYKISARLPSP